MAMPAPTLRERQKPDFPAIVHTYSDALAVLSDHAPLTATALAERTDRDPSNMRRDLHKLKDADVDVLKNLIEQWTLDYAEQYAASVG